ncbi:MAG: hypothetical protein V8T36_09830 [Ruthenibacterium lactatiformans]
MLSFMEAAHGCTKTVTSTGRTPAPSAAARGAAKGTSPETCPDCRGTGQVTVQQRTPFRRDAELAALLTLRRQGQDHQDPLLQVPRQRPGLQHKAWRSTSPRASTTTRSLRLRGLGDAGLNGGPAAT